ncbi:TPA: conjugal transfer protein TraM [Legionella pneumophila]|nr:conjugal transfer protein TraM [Legionella pneumophila]
MSDKMYKAIQDIAVKHGVVLGKDDPVLILQTMNERLLDENRQAQQEMLAQFKEEMENISSHWKDDAKDKAEKVLNAALSSSKEVMAKLLTESTSEFVHISKKIKLEAAMEAQKTQKCTRYLLFLTLSNLAVAICASCLFIFNSIS